MSALNAEERQAAIDWFLRTYTGDYMRRMIRSQPTEAEAIKFCVTEHRHGGGDFRLPGRHGLWIDGLVGKPQRGLQVWAADMGRSGGAPLDVIPWRDVVGYALGKVQVAAQMELPL